MTEGAFAGAIVGLAVGDALGFPVEFDSRAKILATYGAAGVTDFAPTRGGRWPLGTFSDDTQMSIAVGEALVAAGRKGVDALMAEMARRFVAWYHDPENDRAPGRTCIEGCARLAAGAPWREAGVAGSKGCGSAMRVAPIGLYYAGDERRLLEVARASSVLTHGHPAAIESAAAAALLVKLALDRCPPADMHRRLVAECAPGSPDLAARLAQVPALAGADPALALSRAGLGEAWVAEEAVASALWCFWRTPDDYAATVLTAANTDGDSDSIACIAGGISGAWNGIDAIPATWRVGVEKSAELHALAARLAA